MRSPAHRKHHLTIWEEIRVPLNFKQCVHRNDLNRCRGVLLLLVTALSVCCDSQLTAQEKPSSVVLSERGRQVHFSGMLFDGHNDLPWELRQNGNSSFEKVDIARLQPQQHTDIPRLQQGGVKAQFWSVYVPAETDATGDALLQTLQQIDIVQRMLKRYPETFAAASSADDIERIVASGKIASMMGVEGGHCIQGEIGNLQRLYDLGCRYMTLTHSKTLSWADSATDEAKHGGLTEFGEEVIREMNRLGMLVDVSHVSPDVMRQAIRVSAAPVIFSHSSVRSLTDHPRNVPDDVLVMLKEKDGVVMINFYSGFIVPTDVLKTSEKARGTIHDVLDHIAHAVSVAGAEHVGIGSDFDGISRVPIQLEDVSCYPLITQGLLDRGYSETVIHGILGGNVMRV
ncbi:MAG: dipeptidase, partial [Planctomycetaceae bacterium]|nr:dipeptidase [Planctomycetaceae bacterium]